MNVYEQLSHPVAFTIFVITLLLPIFIGLLTVKRTKSQSDFFIGGRAMDKFVVALSAVSSGRSGWVVLGLSGMAYTLGTPAVWSAAGYITMEMFQFVYIGRKLRTQSEAMGSLTLLDYFGSKYKDSKHIMRLIGALVITIFMTSYVAAQLNAGAKSLNMALNLPMLIALIISGILILIYMALGGYIAVAYNDVVRAVIMLLGLVIFPVYGLIKIGGVHTLLTLLQQLSPEHLDPFALGIGATLSMGGNAFGPPGQPHILVRYMSIDDPDKLRLSTVIGTSWNVLLAWGALFIGLLGRVLIPAVSSLPGADPELIYIALASEYFGPVIYGLLIGGIFAAILSTADSQLLVVVSTFVRDIYEKIICKDAVPDEAHRIKLSRIVVGLAGVAAMALAYFMKDTIFWFVLFAWAGMGAAFGPAVILSLYWKKTTRWGIVAGMVTGTLVTIGWKILLRESTGIYEIYPALFTSTLMVVGVSLLYWKIKKKRISDT
jgi:SSS family solute:Na+ symporter